VHRSIANLLAVVLCTDASAASSIQAATIDRNPFGYRDAEGTPQGVSVDVYRLVASRLGRVLNVEFAGVDQIEAGILDARIDLAMMFHHPELDSAAVAIGPLIEVPAGVLTHASLTRYEDLSGLRIGYVDATPFDERFEADTALTRVAFPNALDAFAAYVAGSIDAMAGPLQYLFYQAPEFAARKGTLFQVFPLQNREMWLYVPTAAFTEAERAVIARAIEQMIEANMIESFSDHYFGMRADVP